jgi:hypothetical protein
MNQQLKLIAEQAGLQDFVLEAMGIGEEVENFAKLVLEDYAKKTIQGLMTDPAFVQAMDEYYEQKWAHRFD